MYEYIQDGKVIQSTLESGEDIFVNDQWKREYHFKIASFPVPTGFATEAIEVKEDNSPRYIFKILSDFATDPEIAKEILIKKIIRGLNRRHLKKRNGEWKIGGNNMLRGRVEWNDDFSDTEFGKIFVIDGKRITIEEFGELFDAWEGWHFQLKMLDSTDDKA